MTEAHTFQQRRSIVGATSSQFAESRMQNAFSLGLPRHFEKCLPCPANESGRARGCFSPGLNEVGGRRGAGAGWPAAAGR